MEHSTVRVVILIGLAAHPYVRLYVHGSPARAAAVKKSLKKPYGFTVITLNLTLTLTLITIELTNAKR